MTDARAYLKFTHPNGMTSQSSTMERGLAEVWAKFSRDKYPDITVEIIDADYSEAGEGK